MIHITRTGDPAYSARFAPEFMVNTTREMMPEQKKREKVTAEITVCHLIQFSGEMGRCMTRDEALTFLNQNGRAYAMWKHMMHAAEEYLKATLDEQRPVSISRTAIQRKRLVV